MPRALTALAPIRAAIASLNAGCAFLSDSRILIANAILCNNALRYWVDAGANHGVLFETVTSGGVSPILLTKIALPSPLVRVATAHAVAGHEFTFKEQLMFDLEGKRVVVSGAASGIGLAIIEHLIEVGAHPVLVDISAEGLAAALRMLPARDKPWPNFVCDVTDDVAVAETFRRIESEAGPLYGAVASAGIRNYGLATELSPADWRRVIDINLNGVFYFCSEAARACVRAGGGSIVTLSSVAAFGGLPQRVNYCAAKGGVMTLTKVMAIELATQGVRVNAVAPGSVDTPLARQNTPEQRQRMISRTPLGRLAEPREVSNVVLFLLSDLSSYVTGTSIIADGGWTAALM